MEKSQKPTTNKVFISSTFEDLESYRYAAQDVIESLGLTPLLSEHFGAVEVSVNEASMQRLNEAHLLIVIVGHRYGWVPDEGESGEVKKSVTWLECERARERGIDVIPFLLDNDFGWPTKRPKEEGHSRYHLSEFKKWLGEIAIYLNFTTVDDFKARLTQALLQWQKNQLLDQNIDQVNKRKTKLLPDIDWVEIPAGTFLYGKKGEEQKQSLDRFQIARYPITNCQYQTFIDSGGYEDEQWWFEIIRDEPAEPRWHQSNRPRENISWYEAAAFCRWLSTQLGFEIRLPTEHQWEKAARGADGWKYPWGNGYRTGYANVSEKSFGQEQTTAVGVYPQNTSPYGVMDMVGNVQEWCLNKFSKLTDTTIDNSKEGRVSRGGSWKTDPANARSDDRNWVNPDFRNDGVGFRVVCVSLIR